MEIKLDISIGSTQQEGKFKKKNNFFMAYQQFLISKLSPLYYVYIIYRNMRIIECTAEKVETYTISYYHIKIYGIIFTTIFGKL